MNSLRELKEDFRQWCGLLSIKEIMSNPKLMQSIKRLERMLSAATDDQDFEVL